uniref:Aspartic peptidase DDI1-type domain-containing protein n=2 Tax=Cajanus cajan TaxID=3821 RepID=A0A151RD37_CAJCA|nr:hypothetical protein KK1_038367 [Cajanus cajan]
MVSKALCDLGASINLMPLSIFKRLGIGEVKPTMITLQLADRSVTCPYGVVEDVLVKVDKFIFPTDFVVLDMEEDAKVPIILGRPFLATGRALIDVQQGELMLRVANEKVTFSINEALKLYAPGKLENVSLWMAHIGRGERALGAISVGDLCFVVLVWRRA